MKTLYQDFSISSTSAGFIAVLIGFASSVAIVFQAAQASDANPAQIESWVWALGIGVCTLGLSLYYKRPIIIVWSTTGATLLAASLHSSSNVSFSENSIAYLIGTFVFVGLPSVCCATNTVATEAVAFVERRSITH